MKKRNEKYEREGGKVWDLREKKKQAYCTSHEGLLDKWGGYPRWKLVLKTECRLKRNVLKRKVCGLKRDGGSNLIVNYLQKWINCENVLYCIHTIFKFWIYIYFWIQGKILLH